MITHGLSSTHLGFEVFFFLFKLHHENCGSSNIYIILYIYNNKFIYVIIYYKNIYIIYIFAVMNSSSQNTSSTRHVIYSISEKVCLEKNTTKL